VKVHFTKAKMKNQYKVIDGMQCGMEMEKHQWWSWPNQMMNHKHITKAKARARIQDKDIYEMEMN